MTDDVELGPEARKRHFLAKVVANLRKKVADAQIVTKGPEAGEHLDAEGSWVEPNAFVTDEPRKWSATFKEKWTLDNLLGIIEQTAKETGNPVVTGSVHDFAAWSVSVFSTMTREEP